MRPLYWGWGKIQSLCAAGLGAATAPPAAAMCLCWNILRGGENLGLFPHSVTLPGRERFGSEALPFWSKQRTACAAGGCFGDMEPGLGWDPLKHTVPERSG